MSQTDTLISILYSIDPSIPLNLVFLDATEESIRVTWDPPTDNGGSPLTNYRIQAEERITFALHANLEIAASTTTFNITNLEPYKNYTIRVAAINAGFQRGPDASIIVQTLSLSKPLYHTSNRAVIPNFLIKD